MEHLEEGELVLAAQGQGPEAEMAKMLLYQAERLRERGHEIRFAKDVISTESGAVANAVYIYVRAKNQLEIEKGLRGPDRYRLDLGRSDEHS